MLRKFSPKSLEKLKGVHPNLVMVVNLALKKCHTDFTIFEGVRTLERQKQLFSHRVTTTLNSKHIPQSDGLGYAVDLYPYPINMDKVNHNNPQEIARFGLIAQAMIDASNELGIKIKWGGDWDMDGQTLDHIFFDAPHYELVTN